MIKTPNSNFLIQPTVISGLHYTKIKGLKANAFLDEKYLLSQVGIDP